MMDTDSHPVVSFSCIEGDEAWPGEGNLNSDPLFVQTGHWEDCGAAGQPGCFANQWDPDTGEETAWHRLVFDYHLQSGSPCIDTGTSEGAPTTDIEGNTRPCWKGIDMGAYEYCGDIHPVRIQQFRRGDANADGMIDLSDAVKILFHLFLGDPAALECEATADTDDSGGIDVTDAIYGLSFLFIGGPPPKSPFPGCGINDKIDSLGCKSYPPCK